MDLSDLIGVPYKVHGRSKEEGFDCYGLCIEVLKRQGITLPDYLYNSVKEKNKQEVYDQAIKGIRHIKLNKPELYCLILITINGEPTHAGIYIGNGRIIHSRTPKVCVEKLKSYEGRINGYYKIKKNQN